MYCKGILLYYILQYYSVLYTIVIYFTIFKYYVPLALFFTEKI